MEDQKLKDYFKFNEADLQANRNGQFSENQKVRMAKDSKSGRIGENLFAYIFLFIGLIGVVIAVATAANGMLHSDLGGAALPAEVAGIAAFGCIWPLVWGGIGVRALLTPREHDFKLAKVQGIANINSRRPYESNSAVYTLQISSKAFEVDKSLAEVITPGSQYALYYYIQDNLGALLSTKNILSAESV